MNIIGGTTNKTLRQIKAKAAMFCQPVNNLHIGLHDLIANPVTGQHHYFAIRRHQLFPQVFAIAKTGLENRFLKPGLILLTLGFIAVDIICFGKRKTDIIKPLKQAFLAERINLK